MTMLHFLSLNARGLSNKRKRNAVFLGVKSKTQMLYSSRDSLHSQFRRGLEKELGKGKLFLVMENLMQEVVVSYLNKISISMSLNK